MLDGVTAYGKHLFAAFVGRIASSTSTWACSGSSPPAPGSPRSPGGRCGCAGNRREREGWTDLRGATACELITAARSRFILDRLGPDPLRRRSDPARAFARISRSRVAIGALLMDQAVLAGVGNVYRAEVLFRHRLSPFRPGRDVDATLWARMWADLVTLMKAGVKAGRIVTTERADRERGRGPARLADAHYVYRRTGLPCRICGTGVRTEVMAGRNLFWCPDCQAV